MDTGSKRGRESFTLRFLNTFGPEVAARQNFRTVQRCLHDRASVTLIEWHIPFHINSFAEMNVQPPHLRPQLH